MIDALLQPKGKATVPASRQAVIAYLLVRLQCLSKTKLMKLPYLADLEHTRRYGCPLSDGQYSRDHFGAVDYAFLDTAANMSGVKTQPTVTWFGSKGMDYFAAADLADPADELSVRARAVLDEVIRRFGTVDAGSLGRLTKTTAPWEEAVKRNRTQLDLAVVAPEDEFAHLREVLKRVDRSELGSAEDLRRRDDMVEEHMAPLRLRAMGH